MLNDVLLANWTEKELTVQFNITYHELRQLKHSKGLPLEKPDLACLHEMIVLFDEKPIAFIMGQYLCSHSDVSRAKYKKGKIAPRTKPGLDKIIPLLSSGLSEKDVSKELGCSIRHIKRELQADPNYYKHVVKRLDRFERSEIVRDLKAGMQTAEACKKYNVSASRISQLRTSKLKITARPKLTEAQWHCIKEDLKTMTISAAAKKHKVTRNTIYYNLEKKK